MYRPLSKAPDGTKINRKPGMGGRNLSEDTYSWNYDLPCRNPNCKSHGKPHPNCQCYGAGGEGDFAKGGYVCSTGQPHLPGCEHYLDGGEVHGDHIAAHHGLLGILSNTGNSKLSDPNKHVKDLEKVRSHLNDGNHDKASRILEDHALMGSASKKHSQNIIARLSPNIMTNESHPEALKSASEFMSNVMRGHDRVNEKMGTMLGYKKDQQVKPDENSREALNNHLQDLQENPSKLLDIGGNIGHYMPDQATKLGALASTAIQYFDTIKPKPVQNAPLDTIPKVSKVQEAKYNRQLDIAQQPTLLLQHVKNGTLQPSDLVTVKTLYPGLHESIINKAGQALIKAKNDGIEIPYKQRRSLSLLLGQPLDSTMTTGAMQAIMKSQGPQQMQNQAKGQKKPSSETEFAQINKVDKMSLTPLEARQVNRKD